MLSAIETMALEEVRERSKDSFVIVDVAVGENHQSANSESQDVDAHVLASFMPSSSGSGALHVLISLKFRAGGKVEVSKVHVVKCYTTPLEEGKTRPRVYLPRPGTTAFLVFPRAVVLVSTQKPGTNKDAMEYDSEEQETFEDVVDFRGDLNVEIVGGGPEDVAFDSTPRSEVMGSFTSETGASGTGKKIRNPGVILVAKGAGIVRLETFDLEPAKKETLSEPVKVKSKIEQAVFYGVKEDVGLCHNANSKKNLVNFFFF
jgi:nuclear pore complex protein Nup133